MQGITRNELANAPQGQRRPKYFTKSSRHVTASGQDQIHACKLDFVDGALLGGKGDDLIGRNDHFLASFLSAAAAAADASDAGRAACVVGAAAGACGGWLSTWRCAGKARCVDLAAGADDFAFDVLVRVGGDIEVPEANGTVCGAGDEDCGFDAEGQGPDTTPAVAAATLNLRALGEIPEDDVAATICRGEDLAVRAALEGADEIRVAGKNTDALPGTK